MKRIEVKLSLPVVAPLLDVIKTAADTLHGSLAAPLGVQDIDPEFREAWTDDLLKSQNDELGTLLALFDKEFFSTGTVSFDVGSASGRVESIAVQVGDGGSGKYKAILAGDPGLPTHAIYRPRDLKPFGGENLLPVVAFGNGGCRNGSGEFRNLLSDIASHGYIVLAIGPAGDAVVAHLRIPRHGADDIGIHPAADVPDILMHDTARDQDADAGDGGPDAPDVGVRQAVLQHVALTALF